MAQIKKSEFKSMDEATLNKKLGEFRTELMKLKAQVAIGSNVESPGRINANKKNIARLLTLLNTMKKNKKEVNKKA